ncbi:serine/threonine-protein kinase [Nostoc sp. CMAA1605]|uniref:serine/threonine-protein kinase n=1 Tax=Nostoc sp. CMAA1605 TaxID=2055159 RepID=UPI001F266001|nr:serine/threonine-protein kinase [Nostoc sp. CMAA1605]MCF4966507.1 serine/threonine protein kinase [Nostoc sp. CMAA1605]
MTSILLNNRYQVIQVLGAGGFGETFLAEDTHMPSRRRCVIKQLKPITNDPQAYQITQQRFEREAATLEYLGEHSDQIPKLYAYFLENGQFYLVQEWIHGQTLRNLLETQGCQNETTVRAIVLSLLAILNYVHSRGIIHRDIKPDNIILRAVDQKPFLIDFGAVKETIRSVGGSHPTRSMVIGTPGYMPSEQAVGRPVYATDIYSLGLTAIYLLTGKSPEELPTNPQTGEILWQQYAPQISPDLAAVLNQAIKPQASDRFTTASKMLYALSAVNNIPVQSVVQTAQTQQTQAIPIVKPIPSPKKQQPVWILGGLIIGGLLSGVALSTLTRPSPTDTISSDPIPSSSSPSPDTVVSTPPIPETSSPPPEISPSTPAPFIPAPITPKAEIPPTIVNTPPAPEVTAIPTPTIENNDPVIEPQPTESLPPSPPPKRRKQNTTRQSIPAFPTGTARSTVEAKLGKPNRDLKGAWGRTRAVVYNLIPNQVDLGYLFDRETGELRQTEVAFAQSVDPQVMQNTLNGMLNGQTTAKIQQGLEKVQQRQKDDFSFSVGAVKGQIIRQNCDLIYISVWDADLHDFVNPASAKQC